MTHPESFKAFAFPERHGKLQKITLPWKDPKDGEVVVKVLACGVCGSDEFLEEGHFGATYPRIPGHEIVGDIVQISPTVTQWKVGQRVGGAWHGKHCFTCPPCRSGDFMHCHSEQPNGIARDGGYAEYVTLRAEVLVNLPADTDPAEVAPLLCAGVTVFNALRHMDYGPGDLVATPVFSGLGHLAIQHARKMGLRPVAISTSPSKKDLALRLGAEAFLDSSKEDIGKALTEMGGAKIVVVTANDGNVLNSFLEGLCIGGTLLLLSFPTPTPLALHHLAVKRCSIRGWPAGDAKACEEAIQFARAFGIKSLNEVFTLDQAPEAYEYRTKARFRAVIVPQTQA